MSLFSATPAMKAHPLFKICASRALLLWRPLPEALKVQIPPEDLLMEMIPYVEAFMIKNNLQIDDATVTANIKLIATVARRRGMDRLVDMNTQKRMANWKTKDPLVTKDGIIVDALATLADEGDLAPDALAIKDRFDTIKAAIVPYAKMRGVNTEKKAIVVKFLNMYLDETSKNFMDQTACAKLMKFTRARASLIVLAFYRYIRQFEKV